MQLSKIKVVIEIKVLTTGVIKVAAEVTPRVTGVDTDMMYTVHFSPPFTMGLLHTAVIVGDQDALPNTRVVMGTRCLEARIASV